MEWINALHGKIVAFDTAPLIYFIERNPAFIESVHPFFLAIHEGRLRAVTSAVTLMEVLVKPLRQNRVELIREYESILTNSAQVAMIDFTREISLRAARIRANYNVKPPDAIQLATAIHAKATHFLTNDKRLPVLPNLRVLVLEELRTQPNQNTAP